MHSPRCNDSGWKPLYEAALFETDASKLPEKISAAREAIFDRIEESLRELVASEHQAMNESSGTFEDLQRRLCHQGLRDCEVKKVGTWSLLFSLLCSS